MKASKTCGHVPLYKESRCRSCFARLVEKRIRKALRNYFPSDENMIRLYHDGTVLGDVLCAVLEQVFRNAKRKVLIVTDQGKANVLPWCLEYCAAEALDELFSGVPLSSVLRPLAQISYDDVVFLAQYKTIEVRHALLPEQHGLDVLESKYPKSKQTLVKSLLSLH